MPVIKWTANLAVTNGPNLPVSQPPLDLESYEIIELAVDNNPKEVTLPAAEKLQLLAITSSWYGDALTCNDRPLDQPLVLVGKGAVKLIGADKLTFKNGKPDAAEKKISLTILLGGTA